jgi:hypothetical protein
MRLVRPLLLAAVVAAVLLPTGSALALSYPVTSTADTDTKGTLRASIKEANGRAGPDTIPIEVTGTIELESPLQVIFDPVSIMGPGADLLEVRRIGSSDFEVFGFGPDVTPSSLTGLTISNGRAAFGAGIRNSEGSLTLTRVVVRDNEATVEGGTEGAEGGGVYSDGPLTLRETSVIGNAARASDGSALTKALGGGVLASRTLTVEASTISDNVAEASGDGTAVTAQGGGVLAGTEATISRSTISSNAVVANGGAPQLRAQGGGIQTYEATLTASTLAGNSATSAGLALGANLHSVISTSVRGTLVADPLGGADSCGGGSAPGSEEIPSGGFNLDEDGSCGFGKSSDLSGVIAGLEPLADNGGPTPTRALRADSPAIDRGNSFSYSADQRGLPRPSDFQAISNTEGGDGADIGAFELQVPPPAGPGARPVLVTEVPTDRQAPNTRIVRGPPRVTFKREAKFRFASSEAQSSFQCRLDKKKWRGCTSPYKRSVKPGKHVFKVRAIDRFGNVDPTPARFGWQVKPLGG